MYTVLFSNFFELFLNYFFDTSFKQISVKDSSKDLTDVYRLKFGFRNVEVTDKAFLVNKKPFYFKGFGMHEDADVSVYCFFLK